MINYSTKFIKTLEKIEQGKRNYEVFADFCNIAAISLFQPFIKNEKLENEYLTVINRYKKDKTHYFAELLAITVNALEENPNQDFLGTIYMSELMGNSSAGQFFTPYPVCELMAQVTYGDNFKDNQEYITVSEPCIGAGGIIIALRNVIIKKGLNPARVMFVNAIDIDFTCFNMAYIQLSLLGIPAVLNNGNTLSLEFYRTYYTPVYFLKNWFIKLQKKVKIIETDNNTKQEIINRKEEIIISKPGNLKQLSLFK